MADFADFLARLSQCRHANRLHHYVAAVRESSSGLSVCVPSASVLARMRTWSLAIDLMSWHSDLWYGYGPRLYRALDCPSSHHAHAQVGPKPRQRGCDCGRGSESWLGAHRRHSRLSTAAVA